jgi:hypothetical protein
MKSYKDIFKDAVDTVTEAKDSIQDSARGFFTSVKTGIKNCLRFRKDVWEFRWWDYYFLHNTLKNRLEYMFENWDSANYVGSDKEKARLEKLINILNEIDRLEDEMTVESDKKINDLYEEFGKELFGKDEKGVSHFRKFWD